MLYSSPPITHSAPSAGQSPLQHILQLHSRKKLTRPRTVPIATMTTPTMIKMRGRKTWRLLLFGFQPAMWIVHLIISKNWHRFQNSRLFCVSVELSGDHTKCWCSLLSDSPKPEIKKQCAMNKKIIAKALKYSCFQRWTVSKSIYNHGIDAEFFGGLGLITLS